MQKTTTGTAMTMTRASGNTTPRWTLTMVVVVVKASINPLNCDVSFYVVGPARLARVEPGTTAILLLLGHQRSRRSRMLEIARSWASKCF